MPENQTQIETEPEAPEAPRPRPSLPAGVAQEQVDRWKEEYKSVLLTRVAGAQVIYRPVSRSEILEIRSKAANEQQYQAQLIAVGALFIEDSPGRTAAGFNEGLTKAIATLSGVDRGFVVPVTEELKQRWADATAAYEQEKVPVLDQFDAIRPLWAMLSDDQIFLLTCVKRSDYDELVKLRASDPSTLEDRMIQHSIVWPRMISNLDLRNLPYGVYDQLLEKIEMVSGFTPDQVIVL